MASRTAWCCVLDGKFERFFFPTQNSHILKRSQHEGMVTALSGLREQAQSLEIDSEKTLLLCSALNFQGYFHRDQGEWFSLPGLRPSSQRPRCITTEIQQGCDSLHVSLGLSGHVSGGPCFPMLPVTATERKHSQEHCDDSDEGRHTISSNRRQTDPTIRTRYLCESLWNYARISWSLQPDKSFDPTSPCTF